MGKFLILGAGSEKDPPYTEVLKEMQIGDIRITDPMVIQSCHGCPDLVASYSHQIQSLVNDGHRIVGVFEGGLYFALSGIIAAQVPIPIISCPLDIPAYQAYMVPSGTAAIATTGIERKRAIPPETEKTYGTLQRKKAVDIGIKMLNLEDDTVAVKGDGDLERILRELDNFGIETSDKGTLVLTYDLRPLESISDDHIQIWADSNEGLFSGSYVLDTEKILADTPNTLQARGPENLAIYAAKILSLQRPELIDKLEQMAAKKRKSYPERNLVEELLSPKD